MSTTQPTTTNTDAQKAAESVYMACNLRSNPHVEGSRKRVKWTAPCSRWRKYGHDRLYFDDHDGYIDLQSGSVEGNTPICDVDVVTDGPNGKDWVLYWAETQSLDRETRKEPVAIIEN